MLTILRSREALRDRLDKRRKLLLEETENVDRIVTQVRTMGDEGLKELTRRYDGVSLSEIRVSTEHMEKAKDRLNATLRSTLSLAARNVHRFHVNQVPDGFQFSQPDGTKVRLAGDPFHGRGVCPGREVSPGVHGNHERGTGSGCRGERNCRLHPTRS